MIGNNKINDLLVITWKLINLDPDNFEHYSNYDSLKHNVSIISKFEPKFVLKTCERLVYVCLCPYHINKFPSSLCKSCKFDTCIMKKLGGWADNIDNLQPPYVFSGEEAFRYLCIIASSIDSSTIGESEILGQFKQAYLKQKETGTLYGLLETLISYAYRTGKRVHKLSDLPHGKISIISNAEQLLNNWLTQVSKNNFTSVAIIGNCKMGEKAYNFLHTNPKLMISVFTRNGLQENLFYKKKSVVVHPFTDFIKNLLEFDIIVLCSQCDKPFLTKSMIIDQMNEQRSINKLVLDLGIPRNCEWEIGTITGITLYQMDKLTILAEENKKLREKSLIYANTIIDKEITYVKAILTKKEINNLIINLRNDLENVANKRLQEISNVESLPPDFQRWYHNTIHELMHISQNHLEHSLNITTTKTQTFDSYTMEIDLDSTINSE